MSTLDRKAARNAANDMLALAANGRAMPIETLLAQYVNGALDALAEVERQRDDARERLASDVAGVVRERNEANAALFKAEDERDTARAHLAASEEGRRAWSHEESDLLVDAIEFWIFGAKHDTSGSFTSMENWGRIPVAESLVARVRALAHPAGKGDGQ